MTKDRKQALLQLLKETPKALNGQSLAEHFMLHARSLYRTLQF